jgi:branched-chain amino acid transport system substrate-binding protein
MKRFHLTAAVLIAGLVGPLFVSVHAFAQCEVKLGVVAPMSGAAAQWGIAMRGAAELVAAEYAEKGGLPVGNRKCKISVTTLDGKYTPEGAAAAANNLVSQGIKIIIGPIGAPEVAGIKPVANRNGLLVMCNSFAKDAIGPQWPLVFHLGSGPMAWAPPIVRVAKQKFGMKRVVVTAPIDQGGTDIGSIDAASYRANGVEAIEEYYQRGTSNFAPIITRILNSHPDAVDTASSPPGDSGLLVKQLREAGFNGPIGHLGGPGEQEVLRIAGGLEGVKNFYWYESIYIDSKVQAIADEYKRLMKANPPENNFFYQYVGATRMVTKAITKAGTADDTKKVAAELRSLPVEDPNLGTGLWIGQEFYKSNQEISFPFGMGLIMNGKLLPSVRMDAATGK